MARRGDQWLRKGMRVSLASDATPLCPRAAPAAGPVTLLGVGLGELLGPLLDASPGAPVYAWDRDPFMLRLALSMRALEAPLASGQLRLGLGTDLIEWLEQDAERHILGHPVLWSVYRLEVALIARGVEGPRAAVGVDRLLSEELSAALAAEGYVPCPLDLESWSIEELDRAVRRVRAEMVVSINHLDGLAEFCRERDLAYLCWEVDPSTERLRAVRGPSGHCAIWTYRAEHVPLYRGAGFERVHHLPLAADPERRRPPEGPTPRELPSPLGISFVGSSLAPEARRAHALWLDLYVGWHPERERARSEGELALRRALAQQARDPTCDRLEAALIAELPDFVADLRREEAREDPLVLASQLAASEKRLAYVRGLADLGIDVWGDPGWEAVTGPGVRYWGYAGHHDGIRWIYGRSAINLDVGRLYQGDIVTLRVFDALACGGFVLAEHSRDLEDLLEVGREIESYTCLAELREKARFYLARPEARQRIAERGRAAIVERHSVRHRVRSMLEELERATAGTRTEGAPGLLRGADAGQARPGGPARGARSGSRPGSARAASSGRRRARARGRVGCGPRAGGEPARARGRGAPPGAARQHRPSARPRRRDPRDARCADRGAGWSRCAGRNGPR